MNTLKWLQWGPSLPAVLLIIPLANAQERSSAPATVTRYCSGCHGMDGNSRLPYVPRLAGQSAAYLERKLSWFRSAVPSPTDQIFRRIAHNGSASGDAYLTSAATGLMVGIARSISEGDMKAAAEWFAAQSPARAKIRGGKLIEEGRRLFVDGAQAQGLRACQTCHGPEAQGTETAPRLAGQHAAYVVTQLARFRMADGHSSPEMEDVARYIARGQAKAVAAYLQSR